MHGDTRYAEQQAKATEEGQQVVEKPRKTALLSGIFVQGQEVSYIIQAK